MANVEPVLENRISEARVASAAGEQIKNYLGLTVKFA
jgi:hypothetical protein